MLILITIGTALQVFAMMLALYRFWLYGPRELVFLLGALFWIGVFLDFLGHR